MDNSAGTVKILTHLFKSTFIFDEEIRVGTIQFFFG